MENIQSCALHVKWYFLHTYKLTIYILKIIYVLKWLVSRLLKDNNTDKLNDAWKELLPCEKARYKV